MHAEPYLFFNGRAEEALEFYRAAAGAQVEMLMRFKDAPDPERSTAGLPPDSGDKVMHMSFRLGNTQVLGSDGRCTGSTDFRGFALALTFGTEDQADRVFAALSEGGEVQAPLERTFFSPRFGMVKDKFGVSWMIMVAA